MLYFKELTKFSTYEQKEKKKQKKKNLLLL